MITIFVTKPLSGNPADGIDNVNISIFKRIDFNQLLFLVEAPSEFVEEGSIKRMPLKQKNVLVRYIEKILLLRRLKPNYLFGIGAISEIPFILFKPRKTKYVIDWHTILIRGEGYWRVKTPWFVRRFIFNQADLIIAVSEFSAQSVKKYFPNKKIISILNGVDTNFFNPNKKNQKYLKEKYGIKFDKPIVAFVGTLQSRKRPDLVIEMAKNLEDANFIFIGKNCAPLNFGIQINQQPNAQWIPAMPRQDVAVFLASSDIFIFPSINETCAAVIVEAMASGLPVLTSKSGGNGEMVKNGEDGYLIDFKDNEKEIFLEKLKQLIRNKSLQKKIGENACQRAKDFFSWEGVAEAYKNALSLTLDD
jgi:glycosyltransferase involved in cell wall biosynthesis